MESSSENIPKVDEEQSINEEAGPMCTNNDGQIPKETINDISLKSEDSQIAEVNIGNEDILESNTGSDINLDTDSVETRTSDHTKNDPYAYIDRNGFTSEKYKIEVQNLPKFYGIGELKVLLNTKLKLGANKIKLPNRRSRWLFVCFRCEEDRQAAIKAINGFIWKKQILKATAVPPLPASRKQLKITFGDSWFNRKLPSLFCPGDRCLWCRFNLLHFVPQIAKPAPDPLVKRRNEAIEEAKKRQKVDDSRTLEEKLKDNVIPLWRMNQEQQGIVKVDHTRQILRDMIFKIEKENVSLKSYFNLKREMNNGTPLLFSRDIVKSPLFNGYRNKCEFTIGMNEETGERTVGQRLGTYAGGTVGVAPIYSLPHIPDRMKQAVKVFEGFVRESPLEVFRHETYTGHWRQLTVRLGTHTDQLMLIVGIHPQTLGQQELQAFKDTLKELFVSGPGNELNVDSLYYQEITKRVSGEDQSVELLMGVSHIREMLCGLHFNISPLSFFQVNTKSAELLYETVRSLTRLTPETTLVDVCCGTGSIGLSLAKDCGQVLGLEVMEQAVADARQNAAINNITNCDFYSGPAEDILQSVVDKAKFADVVAVVDPPRAGLRQNAVIMLRRMSKIKRIAYLACDIKSASKNIVDLARPSSKTMLGDPFVPVAATPVDMFPHCEHCENVIYLERLEI